MTARFLLDTDVVSELTRPSPSPRVATFIAALDEILLPAIGLFELLRGVERLTPGKRRAALEEWLAEWLVPPVEVVPFDAQAARAAAAIETAARRTGRTIDMRDLFILGTAKSASLTIATRDVAHFRSHGVPVRNPFE